MGRARRIKSSDVLESPAALEGEELMTQVSRDGDLDIDRREGAT